MGTPAFPCLQGGVLYPLVRIFTMDGTAASASRVRFTVGLYFARMSAKFVLQR